MSKTKLYIAANLLNIIDTLATIYIIDGVIENEVNPLMRILIEQGTEFFVLVKFLIGFLGLSILYLTKNRLSKPGLVIIVTIYSFVCAGHILAISYVGITG